MSDSSSEKILVTCACGARMKAPASAVGKKAKCTKCGQPVRIEGPSLHAAPEQPAVLLTEFDSSGSVVGMTAAESGGSALGMDPNAALIDGKIRYGCLCGARLKMPVEMAGKRAKCPRCGAATTIPHPPMPPAQQRIDDFDKLFSDLAKGERVPPPDRPAHGR